MRIRHLRLRGKNLPGKGWEYTLSCYADLRGSSSMLGGEHPIKISKRAAQALVGWIDIGREDDWEAHVTITYA